MSTGTCTTCGERDHSLLHMAHSSNRSTHSNPFRPATPHNVAAAHTEQSQHQPQPQNQPQSQHQPQLQHQTQSQQPPHTNSLVSQPVVHSTDHGVLATALVIIKAFNGNAHTFRALLDNGSQENFVSRRVLRRSGVRQAQALRPLGEVNIDFGAPNDPSFVKNINAIVLPVITHVLPARNVQVCQTLVEDLELADPTTERQGPLTSSCQQLCLHASCFRTFAKMRMSRQSHSRPS